MSEIDKKKKMIGRIKRDDCIFKMTRILIEKNSLVEINSAEGIQDGHKLLASVFNYSRAPKKASLSRIGHEEKEMMW